MGRTMGGRNAQAWIGLVLCGGCATLALALIGLTHPEERAELVQPAFLVFLVAASLAHAFPVIAPRHQAYHATQAVLMAAVLLLIVRLGLIARLKLAAGLIASLR